mgnify:FL=1|jgi:hypothetical protein|tara:strand:- start:89 stop:559 length:471 start_codon:yes stop_codon:yes gene_type:complete
MVAEQSILLDPSSVRSAPDGLYARHGDGPSAVYSVVLGQRELVPTATVIVPLDADSPDRLAAAGRLWRVLNGIAAPDTRLTPQRRKRLSLMIRAADGVACHASHRQIAAVLFGRHRVAAELWHESSLRYTTIRLCRNGQAMIDGGYRDILRHRRRA